MTIYYSNADIRPTAGNSFSDMQFYIASGDFFLLSVTAPVSLPLV